MDRTRQRQRVTASGMHLERLFRGQRAIHYPYAGAARAVNTSMTPTAAARRAGVTEALPGYLDHDAPIGRIRSAGYSPRF